MTQLLLVTSDPSLEAQVKQLIPDRYSLTVVARLSEAMGADQILMDICTPEDWDLALWQLECQGIPLLPLCTRSLFSQILSSGKALMPFCEKPLDANGGALLQKLSASDAPAQDSRIRDLWNRIAWGDMIPGRAYIHRQCELLGIPQLYRRALPVYVHLKGTQPGSGDPDRMVQITNLLALKLMELEPEICRHVIPLSPAGLLALFCFDGSVNYTRLNACAQALAEFGREALGSVVCSYIGRSADIGDIRREITALVERNKGNISDQPVVFLSERISALVQSPEYIFASQHWARHLYAYRFSEIISDVEDTLNQLESANQLSRPLLEQLVQEFSQFLSITLHDFGIQASDFFDTERYNRLYNIAPESIDNTLVWVRYTVEQLSAYMHRQYAALDPIARVVNYIDTHLTEDLNADVLAEIAHYSKSYLGKAFKEKMQMSFQEYIRMMRLRYAENLLRDTDMPVGKIAEQVGYKSYPGFHVQFRNLHGCSPTEFRLHSRTDI